MVPTIPTTIQSAALPPGSEGVTRPRAASLQSGRARIAEIERGHILLEINRLPVRSIDDYRRLTNGVRSGDILTLYLFKPEIPRRELHTVKVD